MRFVPPRCIAIQMNLVRATATIGGLTLVSRIAGFVRDVLQATLSGAGMAADAFLIAQRLPNHLQPFSRI